jgi:hypothetical protein
VFVSCFVGWVAGGFGLTFRERGFLAYLSVPGVFGLLLDLCNVVIASAGHLAPK